MVGDFVTLTLTETINEEVSGELRRQDPSGVWLYTTQKKMDGELIFYPMHRVIEMKSHGRRGGF